MIYYAFGLLALGLIFIMIEVFIPSMGLIGTMAAVSIIGGGVIAYLEESSGVFVAYIAVSFVLIPTMMILALKVFPKTPVGKHFTLGGPSFDTKEAEAVEQGIDSLLDQEGETLTALHPSGIVLINERRVDVVTRGEMVEKGVTIKVIKVEGNRIVVEKANDHSPYSS